jgi:L-threonylcarbamoyladenylate synthase
MATRVSQDPEQAVRYLNAGAVIAYPTESVWGLGCNPFDARAVSRVLTLKGRGADMGLIVIAASIEQVEPLLADPGQLEQARPCWPGPVTFVFSAGEGAPKPVCRPDGSIAIRVTDHSLSAALCRAYSGVLVSTSANPSGKPPATNADQVMDYFPNRLDLVLSGATGGRERPSEIRDTRDGQTLRTG